MKDNAAIFCHSTAPVIGSHLRSANFYVFLALLFTELSKGWTLEKEFKAELPVEDQKLAENHRTASISEHDATRNNKSANKLAHQLAAQEVVFMQFFHQQKNFTTQVLLHDV